MHPVFFGSAITGAGVDALMAASRAAAAAGAAPRPVSGTVFKVERGPAGEKIAYVRVFAGRVRVRDRLRERGKVTAIRVFERGRGVRATRSAAGQIAQAVGLGDARIGDALGERAGARSTTSLRRRSRRSSRPPTARDRGALHAALTQLAEQDPLINLRRRATSSVSLYGEVQKEVIEATLAEEYGLEVAFRETTTICIERPLGTGAAVEFIGEGDEPVPGHDRAAGEPADRAW